METRRNKVSGTQVTGRRELLAEKQQAASRWEHTWLLSERTQENLHVGSLTCL